MHVNQSLCLLSCSARFSLSLQVILTLAIGLTVFSGYVYYRFWDTVSPEYTGLTDEKLRAEELAGERVAVHRSSVPNTNRNVELSDNFDGINNNKNNRHLPA